MTKYCPRFDAEKINDLTLDFLVTANTDGYFLEINQAFLGALGYSQEEMLSRPFFDFVHKEDLTPTSSKVEALSQGQVVVNFENRYRCTDGKYLWLQWNATTDPETGLIYGVARDITQQKIEHSILEAVKKILHRHISGAQFQDILELAIQELMSITHSTYGFIGEIVTSSKKEPPFLKLDLIAAGRTSHHSTQKVAFKNLNSVLAHTLATGEYVLTNNPVTHFPSADSEAPQALECYLGLPIYSYKNLVGIIGVANRPGGYHAQFVSQVEPYIKSIGMAIESYQNRLQIEKNVKDLEKTNEKLKIIAHTDYLTGLPNRISFDMSIKRLINYAKRKKQKLAVMYLDLDYFKDVNDRLGHHFGDRLLKAVAKRMSEKLRGYDTIARIGGDEFAVLIIDATYQKQITIIANKIIHCLQEPFTIENQTITIGASIGIAIYPDHGADDVTLLKHADQALYQAKGNSRNTYFFYSG